MAADEAARVLEAAFRENGLNRTPPGLERLVRVFKLKSGEAAEVGRRRFFRRVFGILWFGNKVGKGQFRGKALPTYVYPECVKAAARALVGENLRDYPDPATSAVYRVTLHDLNQAKWPGDK